MYLTDMIRAEISCEKESDIESIYDKLKKINMFIILRLNPQFNTPLKNLIVNLDFNGMMICELKITIAKPSPNIEDNNFVHEMARVSKS